MTTTAQILDTARAQLGTTEARDGSTPYHRAYGLPADQPWCAVFCWWVFREAAASDLIHPKTAYTPTLLDWYRQRGQADGQPRVGDLVFFNWRDGSRTYPLPQHVGLVEAVDATSITTIEGNTSTVSQGNGGAVMRRRRARGPLIVGYGHPAYTTATASEDDMPSAQEVAAAVWAYGIKNAWGTTVPASLIVSTTEGRAAAVQAQLQGLAEQVARVQAAGVDPAVIEQAVRDALGRGLTVTATVAPTS